MRTGKNNLIYYTADDITRIVNGEAMGIYHSGSKHNIQKNYVAVLLSRLKNKEEAAGNFNDDYRKPLLIKNSCSKMGRPKFEYSSYYVDEVLNEVERTKEDNLITSFSTNNTIRNNTLTPAVISEIFKAVLQEKFNTRDSSYDLQLLVINSIYRKDRANRKKLLTILNKMRAYRDKNNHSLDNYFHELKRNMNITYDHLKSNEIDDSKKLVELQDLLKLANNYSWSDKAFIQMQYDALVLVDTKSINKQILSKIFNNYKKKKILMLPKDKEEKIIFQIAKKSLENQGNLRLKIKEFTRESLGLIGEKQTQIEMLLIFLRPISDFINSNTTSLSDKLDFFYRPTCTLENICISLNKKGYSKAVRILTVSE